jgi:hypothetical protein
LAEEKKELLERVKKKTAQVDTKALSHAVRTYGGVRAKKFFAEALAGETLKHAA